MELVKELGITLIIGAYTILGFELILFILFGFDLTGYIRELLYSIKRKVRERSNIILSVPPNISDEEDIQLNTTVSMQYTRLTVFVCLSFGIGLLAEDLSYKFVDSELPLELPTRYDTRVQTLIGNIENPKIEPLAEELANNNMFSAIDQECGVSTKEWILAKDNDKRKSISPCSKYTSINKQIEDLITKLYYRSKNNVFLQNNYYDELKKIQMRSDFTRSVSVISTLYFCAILLVISGIVIKESLKKVRQKRKYPFFKNVISQIRIPGIILVVLSIVVFFATAAFYKESFEFNKRVFGYYSTMQSNERDKSNQLPLVINNNL